METQVPATIASSEPMRAAEVKARMDSILRLMQETMKEGIDYGTVPGTPKPSLWKPGAEKIATLFRLGARPIVEELSGVDEIRYRVAVRLTSPSGDFVGEGIGEASTMEEKYKWRRAVVDEEWNDTPADRRREKWGRGDRGAYKTKQVRTQPPDMANTVLKMAKKRGLVDAVLTSTAASAIFTQDVEDLDFPVGDEAPPPAQRVMEPKRRSAQGAQASPPGEAAKAQDGPPPPKPAQEPKIPAEPVQAPPAAKEAAPPEPGEPTGNAAHEWPEAKDLDDKALLDTLEDAVMAICQKYDKTHEEVLSKLSSFHASGRHFEARTFEALNRKGPPFKWARQVYGRARKVTLGEWTYDEIREGNNA